ncbi:ATP-binding protein [Pelotomaculum propionicicum]|uniref:ATP-binding protein n=1 Tax=Pelotomaculum propionicicum TaxID=258475 RepID=UPI003B815F9B
MIKVGIIGGGRGGVSILDALSSLTEAEVIGICDIKPDAPGITLAGEIKTPVYTDYRKLLRQDGLDLVFEVTGSHAVRESVHVNCPLGVEVVDAQVAKLMMHLFEELVETNKKLQSEIIERKKVEEALWETNEKLKELDQLKTDFLSTVSHELRTPLTSVLGFARITQKKLDEVIFPRVKPGEKKVDNAIRQVKENINITISEGERLTELINDVLDIAKLEAGKIEWRMEKLSANEIIERAIAATTSLLVQKDIALVRDIEEGLPDLTGDEDRLIQVLINLISNAVKFTGEGSITFRARKTGEGVQISVIDTGVGISGDDLRKVFDKFKQVGDTLTEKPRGTGLGLAICKQIIDYHGGKIWVESEPGRGSSFSFSIPVIKATKTKDRPLDVDNLVRQLRDHVVTVSHDHTQGEKKILVVDDDSNIRSLLRQELEADGYYVAEAKDGLEAITRAKELKPDLVILDVMMPKMGGFDAAAVLRNDPDTMNIPIVILSIMEDMDRGFRIGIDSYYTKPVRTEQLLKEIGTLVSRGNSKKRVIVVDEDESASKTLAEVLEAKGYMVVVVNDLEGCIKNARESKPDMIIIDSLFSDSYDQLKTLRFEKGLENIFMLMLGKQNDENIVVARQDAAN